MAEGARSAGAAASLVARVAGLPSALYAGAMGFRFSRRFSIMPGVRLNVSKSGWSTSVGRKGAWFTLGPRGTRTTVGVPGTGLSYSEQSARHGGGSRLALLVVVGLVLFVGWLLL